MYIYSSSEESWRARMNFMAVYVSHFATTISSLLQRILMDLMGINKKKSIIESNLLKVETAKFATENYQGPGHGFTYGVPNILTVRCTWALTSLYFVRTLIVATTKRNVPRTTTLHSVHVVQSRHLNTYTLSHIPL